MTEVVGPIDPNPGGVFEIAGPDPRLPEVWEVAGPDVTEVVGPIDPNPGGVFEIAGPGQGHFDQGNGATDTTAESTHFGGSADPTGQEQSAEDAGSEGQYGDSDPPVFHHPEEHHTSEHSESSSEHESSADDGGSQDGGSHDDSGASDHSDHGGFA